MGSGGGRYRLVRYRGDMARDGEGAGGVRGPVLGFLALLALPGRLWRNPVHWAGVLVGLLLFTTGYAWWQGWRLVGKEAVPVRPAGPAAPAAMAPNAPAPAKAAAAPAPAPASSMPADRSASPALPKALAQPEEMPLPGPRPALRWPLRGRIQMAYGWGYSPTMGDWRWHPGVDLASPVGTPVVAAAAGRVRSVRQSRAWGWEVMVDHPGGLVTLYGGCQGVRVAAGDAVEAGQAIASVGQEGLSEASQASHLHFEVWEGENRADPQRFLGRRPPAGP